MAWVRLRRVPATASGSRATIAELMAVLSLGVDLGLGQPMEHVLRQCVIALELARRQGLDASESEVVYFVALISWMGCHSNSHEQAKWFGDDIDLRAGVYSIDMTPLTLARFSMGRVGAGSPPMRRARTLAEFMWAGRKSVDPTRSIHCSIAGELAVRLGLQGEVRDALQQLFERWDGRGDPGEVSGAEIGMPVRLVQLADVVEVFHRAGGIEAAITVARERRGTQFDPDVVDLFCEDAAEVLAPLARPTSWESVISAQPRSSQELSAQDFVSALEAIADFADLKSPYTLGHSRAVADVAAEAARAYGLPEDQIDAVRTAGLLHDLGRLGISNAIWDKQDPLAPADRERIRMQPYLTERMLSACPALAPLAALAASHQERLDGSGYPRGLRGEALSQAARILAAADVYQAMLEPRPHRAALSPAEAADELRTEVRAGRLDAQAVEAVLRAAGHGASRRPEQPGRLTRREIEVLGLLARGLTSKEIAQRLYITTKTVGHHIEHIYMKTGASNRVGASLYATEHGLLSPHSSRAET
jgi:HD-GYP domain-containing protein (c-di-GMP phosphodiesterase class II)